MLIDDKDAIQRLNSPLNLINRLRRTNDNGRSKAMSLFGIASQGINNQSHQTQIPSAVPASSVNSSDSSFYNPFAKSASSTPPVIDSEAEDSDKPSIDNLLNNADSQIKLATAHDKALNVLTSAVEMMQLKLDDIKPDKLPSVISATSKVVESIRKERNDIAKNKQGRDINYIFYTPTQRKIEEYEIIEVGTNA